MLYFKKDPVAVEKQEKTSKQISNKNKTKVNLAVNVVPVIIMLPEIVIKGLLKRATTTVIVLTIKQKRKARYSKSC